jgi:hypothetical protein
MLRQFSSWRATRGPREGCITVHDDAFSHDEAAMLGTAFTTAGIEFLQSRLAKPVKLR